MTESRPWVARTKKFVQDRTCISKDIISVRQTHRDTDRQTDTLITILRSPIGDGVTTTATLDHTTKYGDKNQPE